MSGVVERVYAALWGAETLEEGAEHPEEIEERLRGVERLLSPGGWKGVRIMREGLPNIKSDIGLGLLLAEVEDRETTRTVWNAYIDVVWDFYDRKKSLESLGNLLEQIGVRVDWSLSE